MCVTTSTEECSLTLSTLLEIVYTRCLAHAKFCHSNLGAIQKTLLGGGGRGQNLGAPLQ